MQTIDPMATSVRPEAGLTVRVLGDVLTFKAVGADTDGAYSIVETRTAPGQGTPPHIQADDEAFYVLEGTYAFQIGDEQRTIGPGGFLVVPRNTPHAFQNVSDALARMLIINSPAGAHEQFFAEAGEVVDDPDAPIPPPSEAAIARVLKAAVRHGIELLPLPGQ